jgi:hypothetical protein
MRTIPGYFALTGMLLFCFSAFGYGQSPSVAVQVQIDELIAEAYQSATIKFPCKLKARGKPKMLRWEDADKCMNQASDRVDWEEISVRLQSIRESYGLQAVDLISAVESSLTEQEIPFEKVFQVKEKDIEALLPLSNSLLKYLPSESLMDLPVYSKEGDRVGSFSGVYSYERSGGLAMANSFKISLFQYTDQNGRVQAPTGRLLMDSYGVPWKGALKQPGFRLPSDKLIPKY